MRLEVVRTDTRKGYYTIGLEAGRLVQCRGPLMHNTPY